MTTKNSNKTPRWALYFTGIVMIALGIYALMHPDVSLLSAALYLGIGFIISGINELVTYSSTKGNPDRHGWLVALGVIDVTVGLLLVTRLGFAVLTLIALVGIWVMFTGFLRIFVSFSLKSNGIKNWWVMLLSGILMVFAAGILISNPFVAAYTVAFMVGITLIGIGVLVVAEGKALYPPEAA